MPNQSLGLSTSKGGGLTSSYVKDGLKLYMPYNSPKEVQFVGEGSTAFDGSGDNVDCGDPIITGTGDYTFCAWVKKGTAGTVKNIAGNYAGGQGLQGIQFAINASEKFYTYTAGTVTQVTGATDIPLNVWTHVASTRSSFNAVLYINGVSDATGSLDNDIGEGLDDLDFTISSNPGGGEEYTGSTKNVGIWNRALSATEIQNVMYKTYTDLSGTLSSGLVSWWALESNYLDSTSSDNDGSTTGDPVQTTSLYGGTTPLIPRGFDNAKTVQADAIGTGYASFVLSNDDYIDCGDAVSGISDYPFSVVGWFRAEAVGTDGHLFTIQDNSTTNVKYGVLIRKTSGEGELKIFAQNTSTEPATTTGADEFNDDKWHHFAAVFTNATDMKLYADGIHRVTQTDSVTFNSSTNSFVIGIDKGSGALAKEYQGDMKNIGLWSGALTQAQIQSIMEKTYSELTASEKTTLVSWWGLDSAVGDDLTHVKDEHGGVLGSEELTNGTFDTDSDWTKVDGATTSGGYAYLPEATSGYITQNSLTIGKVYYYTLSAKSADGGGTLNIADGADTHRNISSVPATYTTYSGYFTAVHATFILSESSTGNIYIDSVSVKEVSGNYGELK